MLYGHLTNSSGRHWDTVGVTSQTGPTIYYYYYLCNPECLNFLI